MSVDGAVVATRGALNAAYYGKDVSTQDILIRGTAVNPQSAPLAELIKRAAQTP